MNDDNSNPVAMPISTVPAPQAVQTDIAYTQDGVPMVWFQIVLPNGTLSNILTWQDAMSVGRAFQEQAAQVKKTPHRAIVQGLNRDVSGIDLGQLRKRDDG